MSVYVTGRNGDYNAQQYRNLPQSLVVIVSEFGGVWARLQSWPVPAASAHLAEFNQFVAVPGLVSLAMRRRLVRDSSAGVHEDTHPHKGARKHHGSCGKTLKVG